MATRRYFVPRSVESGFSATTAGAERAQMKQDICFLRWMSLGSFSIDYPSRHLSPKEGGALADRRGIYPSSPPHCSSVNSRGGNT